MFMPFISNFYTDLLVMLLQLSSYTTFYSKMEFAKNMIMVAVLSAYIIDL